MIAAGKRSGSSWAPLRYREYRVLWAAQVASQIGTWMHMVGAQWLMLTLDGSALMVALVQAAISLPIVLLALPAGALGDIFDRRRLLLGSTVFTLVAAAGLAALTLGDAIAPWSLLALTFAIGAGDALRRPSWQAIQPELVPREEIPQASAINSAGINVARAVGPAIGGVVVAVAGAGWVFALNSASFLAVLGALVWWRREPDEGAFAPERMGAAVRAGIRYARSSRRLRSVLARTGLFIVFGSALWALLPVLAERRLGLGSGGYGFLLGAVGVGAVAGTVVLPSLRARLSVDRVVAVATAIFAAASLVLAWVTWVPAAALALLAVGFSWIATIASLNASTQTILPAWVRARGLAFFLLVVNVGQAAGAVLWGTLAEQADVQTAFAVVGIGLALTLFGVARFPVRSGEDLDLSPSRHWVEPELAIEPPDPAHGPVLVTVEYRVPPENQEEFRAAMRAVGRSRRRSGAYRWLIWQATADPERFVETFTVPSWEEHMRQHERVTVADRAFEERVGSLVADGTEPVTSHLLSALPLGGDRLPKR